MDNKSTLKPYFDILELPTTASLPEIKETYNHLKNLYTSNSGIFSSFLSAKGVEKKKKFIDDIERAYQKIKEFYENEERELVQRTESRVVNNHIPEFETYHGDALRIIREVLGINLEDIAFSSGININHLKYIESEQYELLPPQSYIKAFVRKYAEHLKLDPKKVGDDYIKNMQKKQQRRA